MIYILLINETPHPYSLRKLRSDNPHVSFPETPSAETLDGYGVYSCEPAGDVPEHTSTQRVVMDTVREGGVWRNQLRVVDMTPQEIETALILWRETAEIERGYFCMNLAMAGILPPDEAIDAAKGGWPVTFNAALDDLSAQDLLGAQIGWATAQKISRNHKLVIKLGPMAHLEEWQVDALFTAP